MHITNIYNKLRNGFWLAHILCFCAVEAYEVVPRWGQASVLISDVLFIYGGKTDSFNSYSYTSAPSNNDLLYLSLSSSFEAASPPWQLVSSSANASTSAAQGPSLAWHTLSAFNTSGVLLFGGQADPNSDIVIQTRADSALLLDVYNRLNPIWIPQQSDWAAEPIRRMQHATATIPDGRIYIIGGVKTDGSGMALSDHYLFDINGPAFSLLNSIDGPRDVYGHTCIILPSGYLLVIGGYSPSQARLIPFDTIWALDISNANGQAKWFLLPVSSTSLPTPRRAFAAVLLSNGKILIHGGGDADLQTTYSDGWILDTAQNPARWEKIDQLSQLGARRDHFAVSSGNEVIFGFGYQSSAPAPALLQIFDTSSNSFISSHTPPPPGSSSPLPTIPGQTQTNQPTGHPGSGSGGSVHPTATLGPGNGNGHGNGDGDIDGEPERGDRSRTTAIAVGTTFGVIGLIAVVVGAVWYYRRGITERDSEGRFIALSDDDEESGRLQVNPGQAAQQGVGDEKGEGGWVRDGELSGPASSTSLPIGSTTSGWGPHTILETLGLAGILGLNSTHHPRRDRLPPKLRSARSPPERRDMLADEDTPEFNYLQDQSRPGWYEYERRRRDGSTGSTRSVRSILGGSGSAGAGWKGFWSREPSTGSVAGRTLWNEKDDPFRVMDEEGYVSVSRRPSNRRELSYAGTQSARAAGYVDPFADPIYEESRQAGDYQYTRLKDHIDSDGQAQKGDENDTTPDHPHPRPLPLITVLPVTQLHTLSPLSEHTGTISDRVSSSSISSHEQSQGQPASPFETVEPSSSHTSLGPSLSPLAGSVPPRPSSILDPSPNISSTLLSAAPTQPMKRSDSWWVRFSKTSFLDRRGSNTSGRSISGGGLLDFRDPNPPPRLMAIEESQHSGGTSTSLEDDNESPKFGKTSGGAVVRLQSLSMSKGHGKSVSSLQTANSEAIEKMGISMDVVQRVRSQSTRDGSESTVSSSKASDFDQTEGDTDADLLGEIVIVRSPIAMTLKDAMFSGAQQTPLPVSPPKSPAAIFTATLPATTSSAKSSLSSLTSGASSSNQPRKIVPRPPSSTVAERVRAYERRLSQDMEVLSPTNTRQIEERVHKKRHKTGPIIDYGLIPRPSLFVTNPDRTSSDDT